jgi:hypothetical protein
MSAYQTGSVKVTVNSPTVIGYNTAFSTYVKAGDLFRINETGSYPFYEVATVTSATRLSLTASYQDSGYAASTELSGLPYQIVTDFTPNYSFPELSANDTNFKNIYTKALRMIDSQIYQLVASSIAITIASSIETTNLFFTGGLPLTNLSIKNGRQETALAGENLSAGNICYYKSDGKYWKTSASSLSTAQGILRLVATAVNADASGLFLIDGTYKNDAWSWSTVGSPVYLGTLLGEVTQTEPSGAGQVIRQIGWAKAASSLEFDPDPTYTEIT